MPTNPPQNLKNHTKFDPPFHFVLAPLFLANVIVAIVHCFHYPSLMSGWFVVLSIGALLAVFMIRRYALKVQDRVIRLEERLRLAMLLPDAKRGMIPSLTERQLIALRFAGDFELPPLAEKALSENLAPKDIKAAITNWRPDYFRV
jgi:hypothetical protein